MLPVFSSLRTLTAGVLLTLALVASPGVARAQDDPTPPNDPFQDAIRRMERMFDQMERRGLFEFPEGFGPAAPRLRLRTPAGEQRIGVELSTPSAALADQLDLPKGQGLVVRAVVPSSAAEKAGLKPHDILLEFNGKAVPDRVAEFARSVAGADANRPIPVVVLRKGRKQTLDGLSLPELKPVARADNLPPFPDFQWPEELRRLIPRGLGQSGVTTLNRTDDRFTATHKDGRTTVTVQGRIEGGKATVNGVTIDDGVKSESYANVDAVPAEYRERVRSLTRLAEGGRVDWQ